jgi:hypothetical protein
VWSQLSFSTGADYSSGDYGGTQNTEIFYVPFTTRYEFDSLTFKVTVPYLRITGPGLVVGGTESPFVIGNGAQTRTTQSGLGDIVGAVTYSFFPTTKAMPLIEFTGKVKFPTADEDRGLGTGEFDYTVQTDIAKGFGRFTPFGTLGYRIVGDPSGAQLDNVIFTSAGGSYKFMNWLSGGLIFDYRQATSDRSQDPIEFTPYVVLKAIEDWSLNLYGVVGFSDGSPDEGGGLQITHSM